MGICSELLPVHLPASVFVHGSSENGYAGASGNRDTSAFQPGSENLNFSKARAFLDFIPLILFRVVIINKLSAKVEFHVEGSFQKAA